MMKTPQYSNKMEPVVTDFKWSEQSTNPVYGVKPPAGTKWYRVSGMVNGVKYSSFVNISDEVIADHRSYLEEIAKKKMIEAYKKEHANE